MKNKKINKKNPAQPTQKDIDNRRMALKDENLKGGL